MADEISQENARVYKEGYDALIEIDRMFVDSGIGGNEIGVDHDQDKHYLARVFRALMKQYADSST